MGNIQRQLNIIWVLIVCLALLGAYWFEFVKHRTPCPLCFFQRLAMVGIGCSALLNLRFGPRVAHYSLGILFSAVGCMISFRTAPFGGKVLGYSLSSWSAMVYMGSIAGAAILLLMFNRAKEKSFPQWKREEKFVFALLTFLTVSNFFTSY